MLISKERFIEFMEELNKLRQASENLNDALFNYDNCSDFSGFSNFRAEGMVIDLLRILTKDEGEYSTIEYFIYDLEWGKEWDDTKFTESDGTPIDISTVDKLYDYLEECAKEVEDESGN